MSKVVLISNIGNRDLQTIQEDETVAPIDLKCFRDKTKEILDNFEQDQKTLAIPLIKPVYEYVKDKFAQSEIKFLLFASDQANTSYSKSDTYYAALVIQKLLIVHYGMQQEQIIIRNLDFNPSDYDLCLKFYKEKIQELICGKDKKLQLNQDDRICINVTGGTQAMNSTIFWPIIELLPSCDTRILYKSQSNKLPDELSLSNTIRKSFLQNNLKVLIQSYNYGAALELWDAPRLCNLLKAAQNLKLLQIEEAQKELHNACNNYRKSEHANYIQVNSKISRIQNIINDMDSKNELFLASVLYLNAEIEYKAKNYVDFLARFTFLLEKCLLKQLDKLSRQNFIKIKEKKNGFPDIELIDDVKFTEVIKTLTSAPYNLEDRYSTTTAKILSFNRPVAMAILKVFNDEFFIKNESTYNVFYKYSQLRNKTFIAHDFKGINEDSLIYDGYNTSNIFSDLKAFVEDAYGELIQNINYYDQINSMIQEELGLIPNEKALTMV